MPCTHAKADSHIARLAMLLSSDGVGCYECHARIGLQQRVRIQVGVLFLAPLLPLLPGVPPFVVGLFVSAATLVILPLVHGATLEVTPMHSEGRPRSPNERDEQATSAPRDLSDVPPRAPADQ